MEGAGLGDSKIESSTVRVSRWGGKEGLMHQTSAAKPTTPDSSKHQQCIITTSAITICMDNITPIMTINIIMIVADLTACVPGGKPGSAVPQSKSVLPGNTGERAAGDVLYGVASAARGIQDTGNWSDNLHMLCPTQPKWIPHAPHTTFIHV